MKIVLLLCCIILSCCIHKSNVAEPIDYYIIDDSTAAIVYSDGIVRRVPRAGKADSVFVICSVDTIGVCDTFVFNNH